MAKQPFDVARSNDSLALPTTTGTLYCVTQTRLQDKTIVIIGGTSGLGLSAARACIAQGANVVVVGRDGDKCNRATNELGSHARGFAADASQPDSATAAIRLALDGFGDFHGLYHVAGGSGRSRGDGPLDAISDDGWRYTLGLNLDSLFYSNRAAVQTLLQIGHGGSIVNMSSVLAYSPAPRHFATHAYATTKAAAIGLTKAAAAFYATRNIRFNALAPALVDTPLAARAVSDEQILDYIATKQPLDGGRVGVPTDLDGAVVFLLSDESRFMTGQVLTVDGGWSVSDGQYGEIENAE